jgi:pyruvate,water dikinase
VEALGGVHPKQLLAEGKRDAIVEKLAPPLIRIARAFHPRPVVYRAMDFRTNEFRALRGGERHEPQEANPMIGYRGCFRYVADPELFAVELLALHEARSKHDNLHLMIPFVRTEWELRECLDLVNRSPLRSDRSLQRWVMAEVPSVVWRLSDYAAMGIDAVSIGSNDLTQLILGVDRDNEKLARLYDERDAAVLAAIRAIIRRAHRAGMTASICGQAPSVHVEYAEFLVNNGIDSISVVPDAIERTRQNIARAEQRLLLGRARAT